MKPRFIIVSFEPIGPSEGRAIGKITYGLCDYLHKNGDDVIYYVINKGRYTTTFPSESVHWLTRYLLYLMDIFFKVKIFKTSFRRNMEEWMFDFFLSSKKLEGDYLLTTSPFISRTLKKHKHKFRKVFLLPANPNESEIAALYKKEFARYSVTAKYDDNYCNPYRVRQFRKIIPYIDSIIAISNVTGNSYLSENKEIIHVPYIFIPKNKQEEAIVRREKKAIKFLYIAYSVPLKGLHRLLREWKLADLKDAELHVVGDIGSEYAAAFDLSGSGNIYFAGPAFPPTKQFMECDIVVIPSLMDNEPTTAIEALLYEKPVIISNGCGYADFVGNFVEEAVYDLNTEDALAEKLRFFAANLPGLQQKFQPAFDYLRHNSFDLQAFYEKIKTTIAG